MKNSFLLTLALAVVLAVVLVAVPAFAETSSIGTSTISGSPRFHTHQVNDPEHLDKVKNINFDVGIEYENAVRFTDHLRLDLAGRKQINDTSFEEMWRGEAMLVYNRNFIDFRNIFGK